MAFAVVLLHSYDMSSVDHGVIVYESGFYNIVQVLFSQGICRVAVPMFYFISGTCSIMNWKSGTGKSMEENLNPEYQLYWYHIAFGIL